MFAQKVTECRQQYRYQIMFNEYSRQKNVRPNAGTAVARRCLSPSEYRLSLTVARHIANRSPNTPVHPTAGKPVAGQNTTRRRWLINAQQRSDKFLAEYHR